MTCSHAVNFHNTSRIAPWPNFRVKANEQVICSMSQSVVPLSTLTVNQCQRDLEAVTALAIGGAATLNYIINH